MTPADLIDSYVNDVMRRLPRRQRRDVGLELRELLTDSLQSRAGEAGRAADEAMTLDLLYAFGAPAEVADRYHPKGFEIMPPRHAPGFAWLALGGVALQWAASLPVVARGPDPASTVARWWLSYGLGAFWWPGFLVAIALIAGWIGRKAVRTPAPWKPRVLDPDRINRPMWVVWMLAAAVGASILIALPFASAFLPPVLARVFAFDPEFLRIRAPWALVSWASQLVLYVIVLRRGRWERLTRGLRLGTGFAACLLLAWFSWGGQVFVEGAADSSARGLMGLLTVMMALITAHGIWREAGRLAPQRFGLTSR
ncbi:MAG: hypothetical protein WCI21_00825 [Alphaproteobacteria bacterium]